MKPYDHVRLIKDRKRYFEDGLHKGMTGYIIEDKVYGEFFLLQFFNEDCSDSIVTAVKEEDLEVIPADE